MFESIDMIRLLPERPFFSFHIMLSFSFHVKVIPLKFNQDTNLELLTREFYFDYDSRVTNSKSDITMAS